MAWITPTIAAIGALGSAGIGAAAAGNTGKSGAQRDLSIGELLQEQQNARQQALVQALVAQRAVAGQQDAFGSTIRYDPATNTWISALGPLPKAADTAAYQAAINRDTVDQQQQALVNRVNMMRAAQAGPAADQAIRNLTNFRPMQRDALTGLLSQQGIEAARQSYDPLRADVLRSVARTGTAAGPVLRELGLGEAQNLRNTLRDSLIGSMTNVDQINTARRAALENTAINTGQIATPTIGQAGATTPAAGTALASAVQQRAANAPYTTAAGSYGANTAQNIAGLGTSRAISNVPPTTGGLVGASNALKQIGDWAKTPGNTGLQGLLDAFGLGGSKGSAPQNVPVDPSTWKDWSSSGQNTASQFYGDT